jgi:hypothetical protein
LFPQISRASDNSAVDPPKVILSQDTFWMVGPLPFVWRVCDA